MKCYNCGSFLYEGDTCDVCGADVSIYKKIVTQSNSLYNKGLEYAKTRNLSRAVQCLEVAIKMYKNNVNARNLLGLVYYEVGEYTLALAQWVISKNIQPENNLANEFIDNFQEKRAELDKINAALKKYNKAVSYVNQGSYDLAEIQLKKLLNDTPNIVKGHQLLALLLLRKNKLKEAQVALKKADKIDAGNPNTIAYQAAVEESIKEEEKDLSPTEIKAKRTAEMPDEDRAPLSGDDVIIPKSTYKEHNPTAMAILQIIIGVIIGAAIIFFIVTPAKTKSARTELDNVRTDYENQVASLNAKISELENKEAVAVESDSSELENYRNIVTALSYFANEDYVKGISAAEKVDVEATDDAAFKNLYNKSIKERLLTVATELYDKGYEELLAMNYTASAEDLYKCYEYNKAENSNALFLSAVSYQMLADNEKAKELFELYLKEFPEGERAGEAQVALDNIENGVIMVPADYGIVEQPVIEEPVYEEPIYQEPVYQEPIYQEPIYYEEPVYYAEPLADF